MMTSRFGNGGGPVLEPVMVHGYPVMPHIAALVLGPLMENWWIVEGRDPARPFESDELFGVRREDHWLIWIRPLPMTEPLRFDLPAELTLTFPSEGLAPGLPPGHWTKSA